jgi:hypothetical protein
MSRGESGRIVIEVDTDLKRQLYAALALSGSTLKEWFVKSAERYCDQSIQSDLFAPTARRKTDGVQESG